MGPQQEAIVGFYNTKTNLGVGVGFRISGEKIITCAHVVQVALDLSSHLDAVNMRVPLRFVFRDGLPQAEAVVRYWAPPYNGPADERPAFEDIAILELSRSGSDIGSCVIDLDKVTDQARVRAFGFPPVDKDKGRAEEGRLMGTILHNWWQIGGVDEKDCRIVPGFSGSPVWDLDHDRYVGMVVARDKPRKDPGTRQVDPGRALYSYMIPSDELQDFVAQAQRKGHSENARARGDLLSYLPDRTPQYEELKGSWGTLTDAAAQGRPLIYLIHGEPHDAPHAFLKIVQEITLPEYLKDIRQVHGVERKALEWPDKAKNVNDRFLQLRNRVCHRLGLPDGSDDEEIAAAICKSRQSWIFHVSISSREVSMLDVQLIKKMQSEWHLGSTAPYVVILFIMFNFARSERSWFTKRRGLNSKDKRMMKLLKEYGLLNAEASSASFKITEQSLERLQSEGVPGDVLEKLNVIINQEVTGEKECLDILKATIGEEQTVQYKPLILKHAASSFLKSLQNLRPVTKEQAQVWCTNDVDVMVTNQLTLHAQVDHLYMQDELLDQDVFEPDIEGIRSQILAEELDKILAMHHG